MQRSNRIVLQTAQAATINLGDVELNTANYNFIGVPFHHRLNAVFVGKSVRHIRQNSDFTQFTVADAERFSSQIVYPATIVGIIYFFF